MMARELRGVASQQIERTTLNSEPFMLVN